MGRSLHKRAALRIIREDAKEGVGVRSTSYGRDIRLGVLPDEDG